MESLIGIDQEEKGDILILRLKGRLDATSSPLLEKKVNAFIDVGRWNLLFNFEKVEYLSSAGMRLLLSTTKKLSGKEKGKLMVCSIVDNVYEVIKMAGFDNILACVESEEEALQLF